MKKILALALALVMVLGMAACGQSAAPAAAPAAEPAAAEPAAEPAAEETVLTLWSIATESDSSHQAFIDAIAAFEAAHPGVKIEHVTTANEAYKTKIKAAMSSGEGLPDIFFTWGMGFLGEFVNAGRVYWQNKIATTAELILKKAVIKVDSNPQIKDKVSPDMSEILKNGVEEAIPVTKKMMESFEKLKTLTSKVTDKGSEVLQNLYSSGKSAVQSGLNSIKERLDNVQKQDGTDKKDTQQTETGNEETTTNGETKEPVKGFLSDYPNLKQTLGWFGESPLN